MAHAVHTQKTAGPRRASSCLGEAGHFFAHLGEMLAAMIVGMMLAVGVLAVVFSSVLAANVSGMSQRHVFNQFAVLICVVVAAGMTATMVAWMHYRGMP